MRIDRAKLNKSWPTPIDALYPVSDHVSFKKYDSPLALEDVDMFDQLILLNWCIKLRKRKTFNLMQTSYGLKHRFERDTGICVSNGAFKGAMLLVGFTAKDIEDLNWNFNVKHVQ